MPIVDTEAYTEKDLLEKGAIRYTRWAHFFGGQTYDQIKKELHKRFPNASGATLNQVIKLAKNARDLAGRYNRAGNNYKPQRDDYMPNKTLPQAFRYTVNVTFRDSETGEPVHVFVVIDSSRGLTKSEIQDEANRRAMRSFSGKSAGRDSPPGEIPAKYDTEYKFVSAECRTC